MKTNVYQMVTDRIIGQMQQGIIPWFQPWTTNSGNTPCAVSYTTRKPYSLINQFLLGKPGEWLTWKQIHEHSGTLLKGAKSRFVVFFTFIAPKGEDIETLKNDPERRHKLIPVLRYYNVFHIDDCIGIKSRLATPEQHDNAVAPIGIAEQAIDAYLHREASLQFQNNIQSDRAYYSPSKDLVVLPMITQFTCPNEYYSTAFHELTHSTMHENRCNRKDENEHAFFGNEDYSREELVAEIGSAMICNRLGIEINTTFKNTVAYIQSWLEALQNDNKMITWAATRAEKAARYILSDPSAQSTTSETFPPFDISAPSAL